MKGEHCLRVANGIAEPIDPETGRKVTLNVKRFMNVLFGIVMKPQLANRGATLSKQDLDNKMRTDQILFTNALKEYNKSNVLHMLNMHSRIFLSTWMPGISFLRQNGKRLGRNFKS
jgi:hypothetical protein